MNAQGVPTSTMRDGTPKGYAILNVNDNKYSFDYKVAGESSDYQIKIIAPSIIKESNLRRINLYANFFLGKKGDKVQFRIDGKDWKNMDYTEMADPAYQYDVLKYDNAKELIETRRPSTAVNSTHLWEAKFPNKLSAGDHTIEVKATDMYGKTHIQKSIINVVK